ncbi:hypothetical protein K501DRAFT_337358 [Backusella circina FSU 941]|nr:hypothetical protein K501DRAFT_337358 [Backusella circina FSU 941]
MTKTNNENTAYDIILALDFGTTSSGCCYQQLSNDNKYKTEMVSIWPKMGNASSAKVPTELLYTDKDIIWGYRARHYKQQHQIEAKVISNFKKQYKDAAAIDYVSDYLKGLTEHAFATITKTTKHNSPWKPMYCMLIPAVADDEARSRMRRAIYKAGLIGDAKLVLAPEPEAVAVFCLENRKEMNLQVNETLLICNAGGGIIDLSIYKIVSPVTMDSKSGDDEHFQLEEVVLGLGGLYGATIIDEHMRKYIQSIFEAEKKTVTEDALDFMMLEFIHGVKPHIELEDEKEEGDGQNKGVIALHPSLYDCNFKQESVTVGDGVMEIDMKIISREIFSPVIAKVIKLIDTQINRYTSLDHMVLTGGFSQSGYFYKSITSTFSNKIRSIRSFQDSENIAMKGAIIYGLHPDIISKRVLRWTYGIKSTLIFHKSFYVNEGKEYLNWPLRKKTLQSASDPVVGEGETIFPPPNFVAEIFALDEEDIQQDDEGKEKKIGKESSFKLDDPRCSLVAKFDIPFPADLKAPPNKEDKVKYQVQVFLVQAEIKIIILIDDYIGEFVSIFTDDKVALTFDYKNGWRKTFKINSTS